MTPWRRTSPACGASGVRLLLEISALGVVGVLVLRTFALESFVVPSSSMAPTLIGVHKIVHCPRCGYPLSVGALADGHAYGPAACPNCQYADIDVAAVAEQDGDRVLVNKGAFAFRRPRRWEVVAFRGTDEPGKTLVKRVVGLPGETVVIHDGDIYVDGHVVRKTLAECRALRVPVFDCRYSPDPSGWTDRWLMEPAGQGSALSGQELRLDGISGDRSLVYRQWLLDNNREGPITDGCRFHGGNPVHDFMLECDVEVVRGSGCLEFAITDGAACPVVAVPAGQVAKIQADGPSGGFSSKANFGLLPGERYHVELSFFDRRLMLAVNGRLALRPIDYPPAATRANVTRPIRFRARGVEVRVHNVRIDRDIHYLPGNTPSAVHLGQLEYFVLGDNSPDSEDSRFWKNPAVPAANLLGKPFLVHLPGRTMSQTSSGRDFWDDACARLRWIR